MPPAAGRFRQSSVQLSEYMMKLALFTLCAAALVVPFNVQARSATASLQASLVIVDSCDVDSHGSVLQVQCRHASAYRVDGNTVTF